MSNDKNIDHKITDQLNIIDSVLSIKCSGIELEDQINNDLNLPQGKSIAELIYDQEENRPTPKN